MWAWGGGCLSDALEGGVSVQVEVITPPLPLVRVKGRGQCPLMCELLGDSKEGSAFG